ncbi:MAG: hypothetical protein UX74_C0022G0001 [Parcubacteria group bacterium GW2011_GWA2_47_10b]|nr:MAG: hypothetical protein UX74_C0022G0001 [Parcubacteria group bacterium GW2011_GWA2_47_10b]
MRFQQWVCAMVLVVFSLWLPLPVLAGALDVGETAHLIFMREEEKLARDVYLTMATLYPAAATFSTIGTQSEQTHTDTVRDMLAKYGIPDPNPDANNLPDSIGSNAIQDAVDLSPEDLVVDALHLIEELPDDLEAHDPASGILDEEAYESFLDAATEAFLLGLAVPSLILGPVSGTRLQKLARESGPQRHALAPALDGFLSFTGCQLEEPFGAQGSDSLAAEVSNVPEKSSEQFSDHSKHRLLLWHTPSAKDDDLLFELCYPRARLETRNLVVRNSAFEHHHALASVIDGNAGSVNDVDNEDKMVRYHFLVLGHNREG